MGVFFWNFCFEWFGYVCERQNQVAPRNSHFIVPTGPFFRCGAGAPEDLFVCSLLARFCIDANMMHPSDRLFFLEFLLWMIQLRLWTSESSGTQKPATIIAHHSCMCEAEAPENLFDCRYLHVPYLILCFALTFCTIVSGLRELLNL